MLNPATRAASAASTPRRASSSRKQRLVAALDEGEAAAAAAAKAARLAPVLEHLQIRAGQEHEARLAVADRAELRLLAAGGARRRRQPRRDFEGAQHRLHLPERAHGDQHGGGDAGQRRGGDVASQERPPRQHGETGRRAEKRQAGQRQPALETPGRGRKAERQAQRDERDQERDRLRPRCRGPMAPRAIAITVAMARAG